MARARAAKFSIDTHLDLLTMGKAKSAKAAEKKRQRLLAAQVTKRVKESIKAAYEVENPAAGLEPFLAFDVNIAPSSQSNACALGDKASDTVCLLYTSPSPRDRQKSRMPSSA